MYIIAAIISIVLFVPVKILVNRVIDPPFQRWLESRHESNKQDIQHTRDQNPVSIQDANNIVVNPIIDSSTKNTDDKSVHSPDVNGIIPKGSDPPLRVFPEGPYKDMTPEEVKALQKRKSDLIDRKDAYWERSDAVWHARNKDMDDAESLMLSVFKSMPDDQLDHIKQASLDILPEQDVNLFFDDLENKGKKMTVDQLSKESKRLITSDNTFNILLRELDIEWEGIRQEHIDIYGEQSYNDIYESD